MLQQEPGQADSLCSQIQAGMRDQPHMHRGFGQQEPADRQPVQAQGVVMAQTDDSAGLRAAVAVYRTFTVSL